MVLDSFYLDTQGVYRVPAFERFDWLEHGFGTRQSVDWPDRSHLAMLKQIHSSAIVDPQGRTGFVGEGDALVTARPGQLIGVRTADCVPILLVDSRNRAVAAVHAGWRGTAQEILSGTVSEMTRRFGTAPGDVYAAIGPSIGECCYEVGPEVWRQFTEWWPGFEGEERKVKLDLGETNRRQLIAGGVLRERIFSGSPCTSCAADLLHSYRRDRDTAGRMIAAIGILA